MNQTLSLNKYRLLDISFFTILMIAFEFLAVKGIRWFSEVYSVSLLLGISLIVMMRWGIWSIITIIAGTLTYCLANGASWEQYLIYLIGNLFLLFNLFWFYKKDQIGKGYITVCFVLSGYGLIEIGRSFVASILKENFLKVLIAFLGTDAISVLITILIVLIARKQNGLFEDQITYLKRIQAEENSSASLEVYDEKRENN